MRIQFLFIWLPYVLIGRLFDIFHRIIFPQSVKQLCPLYFASFKSICNCFHYRVSLYLIKEFTLENQLDQLGVVGTNPYSFPRPAYESYHNKKSHKNHCSQCFCFHVTLRHKTISQKLRNKRYIYFTQSPNFLENFLSF